MEEVFQFSCPECQGPLETLAADLLRCGVDGSTYERSGGIWRFLTSKRQAHYARFIVEYESIRLAEGRAGDSAAYYQTLPFAEASHNQAADWQVRAQSFTHLKGLLGQMGVIGQPLRILDLGAGNCWLSHQLSLLGHHAAAIDLTVNQFDGLGAHVHYDQPLLPIQAEFDRLPLVEGQADLAVFNSSFHYSTDYEQTLREARRVLTNQGRILIVDTPFYHDGSSGERMVKERQTLFRQQYGFPSNSLASRNFLTYDDMVRLARSMDMEMETTWPVPKARWAVRRWRSRLRGRREPAQFPMVILRQR